MGKVDLLIGTNDVRLHPYLADPIRHLQGNLRLMTSMFGTGVLIDGSHPDVKAGLHHDYQEEAGDEFEQKKLRGFKRGSRTSHHSSVGSVEIQELRDQGSKSKGRPSRGKVLTTVSARGEVGVEVKNPMMVTHEKPQHPPPLPLRRRRWLRPCPLRAYLLPWILDP